MVTLSFLSTYSQLDTAKLNQNRKLMSGKWLVNEHTDIFSFANDSSGTWTTQGKVTGAPLFVIRQKNNRLFIVPITELGDYTNPIEIKSVDAQKMVFYYTEAKRNLTFKRVTMPPLDSSSFIKSSATAPEIPAEFPGGNAALMKYIKINVSDKAIILDNQPVEKVIVRFYIDVNGEVSNVKIHKSSKHDNIDKLLFDAVNKMPKWTPAQNPKGENVGQEFFIPLYIHTR